MGLKRFLEELGSPGLPDIAGTYSGKLLILGDAKCVWDDVAAMGAIGMERGGVVSYEGDIMCINGVGQRMPGQMTHWYSNNAKWLKILSQARRPEFYNFWPDGVLLHSNHPGVIHWPWPGWGSSGLGACFTAVALGYDEITLCGVPLDDSGHDGEPPWRETNFRREVASQVDNQENRFWQNARLGVFEGKVKSCSGRSADWLGRPAEIT